MGDNSTDDLTYEDYAVEDYAGGTDSSAYYNDDAAYNYDESSELTDIDYNPYDQSAQFTNSGTGTEAFDPVARRDEEENENLNEDVISSTPTQYWANPGRQSATENFVDDYEDVEDNFDGNDAEPKRAEQSDDNKQVDSQQANTELPATQEAEKEPDGPIKWKPGDEITLEILNQVWKECREIDQVRPMLDSANTAAMEALNTLGPNLMIRLNNYIDKTVDNKTDTIGCLLTLASKDNKRLVFTALSAVEAIFDQQWTQTTILATLPTVLKTAISTNPLKGILNGIFTIAVPLINKKLNSGE